MTFAFGKAFFQGDILVSGRINGWVLRGAYWIYVTYTPLLFVVQTAALLEDRHDEDPLAPSFKMYSRSKSNLTSGRCKTAMTGCYKGGALLAITGVITPYILNGFINR